MLSYFSGHPLLIANQFVFSKQRKDLARIKYLLFFSSLWF